MAKTENPDSETCWEVWQGTTLIASAKMKLTEHQARNKVENEARNGVVMEAREVNRDGKDNS